ncbi:hypothetical protein [Streptomyces sp. NPDC000410]|uniref:hypothetical protein n=1 Tax=Streptomyces sp. NPDC000410 TaxID=3154254 RepID=UPI00332647AC
MGIESDQLVFDYLSRVGDLAQQRQLPSGTRMRLVSSLRNEIDRQRAKYDPDSPAAVRRILGRLGTPDEVVAVAAGEAPPSGPRGGEAEPPRAAVPEQRGPAPRLRARRFVPRPRKADKAAERPEARGAASPPHLAGMDELGPPGRRGVEPDWWRVGSGDDIGGFVGGVEIPELLKPPPEEDEAPEEAPEEEAAAPPRRWRRAAEAPEEEAAEPSPPPRRWRVRRPWRRATEAAAARKPLGNPLLLIAAALLALGAALGSWLALAGGWLLAYGSSTLSRTQAKWAVFVLPGAAASAGAIWLWGRLDGRWGDPVPAGGDAMGDALAATWPWVVRGAAVASALYLLWRARRR